MKIQVNLSGETVSVDLARPIDISIPLDFHGDQPRAFYLPVATSHAFEAGGFVGDVRRGGSANCETIALSPHGNGTHTECVGHITGERVYVGQMLQDAFVTARVVSVRPVPLGESGESYLREGAPTDLVITREALRASIAGLELNSSLVIRALVIRTLPNETDKKRRDYSGQNPVYLSFEAMEWIRERGIEHLLVDVPSVDREEDGGHLANHHGFWEVGEDAEQGGAVSEEARRRTITEMIYVPDEVPDDLYLLNIQIPHFLLDAAPSRPLLFRAIALQGQDRSR